MKYKLQSAAGETLLADASNDPAQAGVGHGEPFLFNSRAEAQAAFAERKRQWKLIKGRSPTPLSAVPA